MRMTEYERIIRAAKQRDEMIFTLTFVIGSLAFFMWSMM